MDSYDVRNTEGDHSFDFGVYRVCRIDRESGEPPRGSQVTGDGAHSQNPIY
jgi:hypothetical protein